MTATQTVFHQQRHLLRQTQAHLGGQVGGLAEVDQVLEGESERDGFYQFDGDVLIGLVDVRVLADGDGAAANVTLAGELDSLLGSLDDHYFT